MLLFVLLLSLVAAAKPTSDIDSKIWQDMNLLHSTVGTQALLENSLMTGPMVNSDSETEDVHDPPVILTSTAVRRSTGKSRNSGEGPINLIRISTPEYHTTVRFVWNAWNTALREDDLDDFHRDLIASKDHLSIQPQYYGWAGIWFTKYRFYKEIGEEIDRRMKDGQSLDSIINRLEFIRLSIRWPSQPTINSLVEGLRHARGEKPFNKQRKKAVDIRRMLEEEEEEEDSEKAVAVRAAIGKDQI
jgi:hypothetical protein